MRETHQPGKIYMTSVAKSRRPLRRLDLDLSEREGAWGDRYCGIELSVVWVDITGL